MSFSRFNPPLPIRKIAGDYPPAQDGNWLLDQNTKLTKQRGELLRELGGLRQERDMWRWRCKFFGWLFLFAALRIVVTLWTK